MNEERNREGVDEAESDLSEAHEQEWEDTFKSKTRVRTRWPSVGWRWPQPVRRIQITKFVSWSSQTQQVWSQKASCTHPKGRACVGSEFRRLERKNRGAGMDLAGFWILALFEYFLTKREVCTRWKKKMFFLFLFSPWPHGPLPGPRLQANRLHLNFRKIHAESQYQI